MQTFHHTEELFNDHESYKEPSLTKRRFNHKNILPLIEEIKNNPLFDVACLGESVEGRGIFMITLGRGKTNVLAWSQMHGDEATATMTLFDIFNFFKADDKYNSFKETMLQELTLHFIPMLNPDGAERFIRYNAFGIDINRDALQLVSPEAKILMAAHNKIKPEFGFNLHDQNSHYRAGYKGKPAAISFVTPPFDYEKTLNDTRRNSMKLIVDLNKEISKLIPGNTARYSDEFEPRSFGDNFTKLDTSSILIESGSWKDDSEKQHLRRVNFAALLTGFNSIANKHYETNNAKDYFNIPENRELMFDLLIKNATIQVKNHCYKADVGINHEEQNIAKSKNYVIEGTIEEIGDLSTFSSNNLIDCEGMTIHEGQIYPQMFNSVAELQNVDFHYLISNDYLWVKLEDNSSKKNILPLPINILQNSQTPDVEIKPANIANFVIKADGVTKIAVINGQLTELTK